MILGKDWSIFYLIALYGGENMATVKPVQPSVAENIDIWKKIVAAVLKKPSDEQIKKMQQEAEKFSKVCADD